MGFLKKLLKRSKTKSQQNLWTTKDLPPIKYPSKKHGKTVENTFITPKKQKFEKRIYSVYLIKNTIYDQNYFGMTSNYRRRKSEHFDKNYRYHNRDKKLYKAMYALSKKENKEIEFIFSIKELLFGLTEEEAKYAEADLINNCPSHYNVNKEKEHLHLYKKIKQSNPELIKKLNHLKKELF